MGKYFGTDGFRGEANVVLTVEHAFKVGRYLGWYFGREKKARIVIGKDTRRSSYMFEYALASGLTASGADAYLLHVTTTPSVSYVVRTEDLDCGIMISASHNPFYDNGIKVINGQGHKIEAEVEEQIEAYIDGKTEELPLAVGEHIGRTVDYAAGRNRYIGHLISLATRSFKDMKIGLDCANGSSSSIAKSVYDAGDEVDTCYDGEEALECILIENYDLVVLDLNLPGMDGMEILKELRQSNEETKVLILSARGQIADKVEGLDAGANDYMEKPFHLQELEARIRSLTRRKFVQKDVCLESGDIKFDTIKREAYAKEIKISLTRKEKGILEYLLLNQGRPVSQEELMEHVWDASVDSFSGAIRVHMSSLRRKLKAVLGHDVIMNKVGEGYKIREEADR